MHHGFDHYNVAGCMHESRHIGVGEMGVGVVCGGGRSNG